MTATLLPSVATSTGLLGRLREMSASSRPEHQDRAGLGDVGRDGDLGGDLVVERRQGQRALLVGLEQHAGEHRHRRTGRQAAGHPGHGLGEDVTLDPELHRAYLPFACGRAASSNPTNVIARLTLVPGVGTATRIVGLLGLSFRARQVRAVGRVGPRGWIHELRGIVIVVIGGVDPVDHAHRLQVSALGRLCTTRWTSRRTASGRAVDGALGAHRRLHTTRRLVPSPTGCRARVVHRLSTGCADGSSVRRDGGGRRAHTHRVVHRCGPRGLCVDCPYSSPARAPPRTPSCCVPSASAPGRHRVRRVTEW